MIENKRFTKNDSGFTCEFCGREVLPLGTSSRDHCPFCLRSKHVDVNPGDRANPCMGIMEPIRTEPSAKHGYVIYYKCSKCGELHRNRAAYGVATQPDDIKLLIRLTANN